MTKRITKSNSTLLRCQPEKIRMLLRALPILIIAGLLLGCNFVTRYQVSETKMISTNEILVTQFQQVPSIVDDAKTPTVVTVDTGPTPLPTQISLPPTATSTLQPSVIVPTNQERQINFLPGGTSAQLQKESIRSGESHVYTLRATEGQTMILTAISENHDVFLDLKGLEDGSHLVETADAVDTWEGTLPSSQEYQITITTANPDTYYFLDVELPAIIQFETGEDSVVVDGHIEVHHVFNSNVPTRVRYLVNASAGQTMALNLTSPNLDGLSIGIVGQSNGQTYVRYVIKYNGGWWEWVFPSTQGYYIDVYSFIEEPTDFKLEISIN